VIIGLTGIQFVYWLNSGKGSRIYGGDIQYMPCHSCLRHQSS
jgi:hypothetical protein